MQENKGTTIGADLTEDFSYSVFKLTMQYKTLFITMRVLNVIVALVYLGINVVLIGFRMTVLNCDSDDDLTSGYGYEVESLQLTDSTTSSDYAYQIGFLLVLLAIFHTIDCFQNIFELYQIIDSRQLEALQMFFTLNACYGTGVFVYLSIFYFNNIFLQCATNGLSQLVLYYWFGIELIWFYCACVLSIIILVTMLLRSRKYGTVWNMSSQEKNEEDFTKQIDAQL